MNEEIITKAKEAESAEEILELAKENGFDDFTGKDAEELFERLHTSGELTDEELENVSGGCGKTTYTYEGQKYQETYYTDSCSKFSGTFLVIREREVLCKNCKNWHKLNVYTGFCVAKPVK